MISFLPAEHLQDIRVRSSTASRGIKMRQKLEIAWDLPAKDTKLKQFKRYLSDPSIHPMLQNGCDLLTIQHLMLHNDINTSMRYLHLADDTKREKYKKYLVL
jgi:hypothetical protein